MSYCDCSVSELLGIQRYYKKGEKPVKHRGYYSAWDIGTYVDMFCEKPYDGRSLAENFRLKLNFNNAEIEKLCRLLVYRQYNNDIPDRGDVGM